MKLHTEEEVFQLIKYFVQNNKQPVLEILGPTASGKTGFSLAVVEFLQKIPPSPPLTRGELTAEIVSVDSRQVYREIDIASAKIIDEEKRGIPHHGLDLLDPTESFSVYEFQQYAFKKIRNIHARGAVPILCGGTMLWLDAVSENYVFDDDPNVKSDQKGEPRWPVLKIGIHWERSVLYDRINRRAELMFANGLVEETKAILEKYPPQSPLKGGKKITRSAFTSFGYEEIQAFLEGKITCEEALALNQKRNRNYAKRQLTWWRGREDVVWLDGASLKQE